MTVSAEPSVPLLQPEDFAHYVERFNADDQQDIINLIPNTQSWQWMRDNIPLFECPDKSIEEIYYYRWWTYRKHIKQTPAGRVVTEFITPVKHAGAYNTISCALGHHIAEGRWLRDQSFLDEYIRFWFRGNEGKPQPHFHKYSQWTAAAMWDRARVTGDLDFLIDLLPDLVADYQTWEREKRRPDGLFWQYDVWDGMEESISGSRTHRNARPTINSYMCENAVSIAHIAALAQKWDIFNSFSARTYELEGLLETLWDKDARFYKAQTEEGPLSDAREAIGFIPWWLCRPKPDRVDAWKQLINPEGFWAPFGITTAERRDARFRSHGVGRCEWDGAVWPFATSQTLNALANVIRHYEQSFVTREHYLEAMQAYAKSHHRNGKPYIGEYLDETTGDWLKGDNPRSRYYNHSTFCDLVISGLCGVTPRGRAAEVDPLLPATAWDWFCLDRIPYQGRTLSIIWDRDGTHYARGAGLGLFASGQRIAHAPRLEPIEGQLP
jgi:hypothetical protein